MRQLVERLARFMAVLGGLVLLAIVIMIAVSVTGRGLNTLGHSDFLNALSQSAAEALLATGVGPVDGDFELTEAGMAFCIFAFLPICQLSSGHARVDLLMSALPSGVVRALRAFWEVVLSGMILLLTAQLYAGLQGKIDNGETTFILQFPVWWSYAASFGAAVIASIVAVYCAYARVAELVTGESLMPEDEGAAH